MAVYRETDGFVVREYALEEGDILRKKTDRALIDIVPTKEFGKALFIDNELQLTEKDEYIYHEAFVHPCLSFSQSRKKICIIGGGDGCAVREVLKWPEVEAVDLIDWDSQMTELFRTQYSGLNKNALQHIKVRIENENIRDFLHEERSYDCILIDLIDPNPEKQYQVDLWYDILFMAKHWISDGGCVVMNAGGITPWNNQNIEWLIEIVQRRFSCPLKLYKTFVPSFAKEWCFILLSGSDMEMDTIPSVPQGLRYLEKETWAHMGYWSRDYPGSI